MYSVKGIDFNEKDIEEIIEKVDIDNNGKIQYTEFLMAFLKREEELMNMKLETAFKKFDKNDENEVTVEEIKYMLQSAKSLVDDKMI